MYKIDSTKEKPDTKYLYNEIVKMMQRGIKVGDLPKLYKLCMDNQEEYLEIIKTRYGIYNPNSSAQVVRYLEDLNDPNVVEACASTGKWTSNKAALQIVESLGYSVGTDIINYRTFKKYGDSIKGMMDAMDTSSRIHPEVSLTKTNRISYKNPAIMNIPKELLWDAVVPSKPGNILISADIKNQEPNILINMNNIKSLKPALQGSDDLYTAIFQQIPVYGRLNIIFDNANKPGIMDNSELKGRDIPPIYYTPKRAPFPGILYNDEEIMLIDVINLVIPIGSDPVFPDTIQVKTTNNNIIEVPIEFNVDFTKTAVKKKKSQGGIIEVDGELKGITIDCSGAARKEFKRAWNAMTYGASKFGVKQMCKIIDGEAIYDFFTKIPELQEYRNKCQRLANNNIQTTETYFGTKLYANEPNSRILKRVLLDLPVQGTAADILSLLVKHFNDEVTNRGLKDKLSIYYTRHDELIIEADEELVNKFGFNGIKDIIADIVVHQVDDWVPFRVDIKEVESNLNIKSILESDDAED